MRHTNGDGIGIYKEKAAGQFLLNKNMEVIYNGLSFEDQEDIDTKKEKLSYIPGAIHLGMVGNFSANKGQLEMLKSVNAVREAVPHKLQVFLIGNIYDQEYYEKCRLLSRGKRLAGYRRHPPGNP